MWFAGVMTLSYCYCHGYIFVQLPVGIVFETEIDAGDQGFLNKLRPVEHFNEV